MTAEELQLKQIEEMPRYSQPETFEQKLYRKVSEMRIRNCSAPMC
jgi:hypothetical protein